MGRVDIDPPSRQNSPVRFPVLFTLFLAASAAGWSQADPGYLEQKQRMAALHVRSVVKPWLAAAGVPGAAVSVVEGDHILALEGFGLADTRHERSVSASLTVFRAGDLVRALTATAALQLAEQGVLDLDEDISQSSGLKILRNGALGPLTPADLLLHTAGIDQRLVATQARTPADLRDLATYLGKRMPPRARPPGLISIPSTHGYALVGRLIENATGEDFDTHLERKLFSVLDMTNTAVGVGSFPVGQMATGYRRTEDGLARVSPHYSQTAPASALATTAADMANWMRVVLGDGTVGGRPILKTQSLELLLQQQFTAHQSLAGRTLAFGEGEHFSPAELYLASVGNGFSSILVLLPHRKVGLFLACNSEVDLWSLVLQILEPFDIRKPTEKLPVDSTTTPDKVHAYGFWQDAAVSLTTAEKLASLVRQDRIVKAADGGLLWRSQLFAPEGSDCYREQDTHTRLCFVDGSRRGQFAVVGDLVLERLSWYQSRPVQVLLWIAFATLFLAAGWPRATRRPHRQPALQPDDAFSPRWPAFLARTSAALHFVFISSLALFLAIMVRTGSSVLSYEVPALTSAILCLPMVSAVLTLGALTGLGSFWRSPQSTPGLRFRFVGLLGALVAFLPFLWSWNLLGFHL